MYRRLAAGLEPDVPPHEPDEEPDEDGPQFVLLDGRPEWAGGSPPEGGAVVRGITFTADGEVGGFYSEPDGVLRPSPAPPQVPPSA